ncbi:DNA adenine methylase [Luteimonas sp. SDU101]|uniref:DNA adenine methylase n=1 Tax=Luteimonas sp. SDU101 TaxID=3422593 RepID=UPI003EB904EB
MDKVHASVIRWAGSKRKLLPILREEYGKSGATGAYIEPFAGSAALFFALQPKKAILADANRELIAALRRLKKDPEGIYREVTSIQNDECTYYKVRSFDDSMRQILTPEGRFFYLNRFCFNGIYRTNKKGEFNVPYGGQRSGGVPSLEKWEYCAKLLSRARLKVGDFCDTVSEHLASDSFVYMDPPYAVSNRRIFKQYSASEFGLEDVRRLIALMKEIDRCGARFLVSYAQSPETLAISNGWRVRRTTAQRNVAGFTEHRRKATEVLISNF